MLSTKGTAIIILFVIMLSAGCREQEPLPTLAPTAELPTLIPTATSTPTAILTIRPTISKSPTTIEGDEQDSIDPTPSKTNTPTPVVSTREPTPLPPSGVNITSPIEGTTYQHGHELIIGGRAQLSPTEYISLTLLSATGTRLDDVKVDVNEINNWQTTLTIPPWITGPAFLFASVNDDESINKSSDEVAINIQVADDPDDRAIVLFRPEAGDLTVNGSYVLFDGWVQRPLNNIVTVTLWGEECRVQAAVESFRLNGSGNWWGLLFVPTDLVGQVCAAASFGSPGESDWREAQTVIEVLSPEDIEAKGVVIAIPRRGAEVERGQSLTIQGLAYNAPERLVTVSILLNNGRLLTEGVVGVERYGYWEISLFIPTDAQGDAHITASIGTPGDEDYSEVISAITID